MIYRRSRLPAYDKSDRAVDLGIWASEAANAMHLQWKVAGISALMTLRPRQYVRDNGKGTSEVGMGLGVRI